MAMTLSDFQGEVRANIKRSSDAIANSRITTWLNWAQNFLADLHNYEEMQKIYEGATIADQKRYGFPARLKDIYTLRLIDGNNSRKLIHIHPRDFDDKVPYPEQTTTGRSLYYVDYGVNFELYRIPDASYVLELRANIYPVDLSGSSDTSELVKKDALICAVATFFGFLGLREVEDAIYWREEVAKPLYDASLQSDHANVDWTPIARGFDSTEERVGVYWTNPLIKSNP